MRLICTYISKTAVLVLFIWIATASIALGQEGTEEDNNVQDSIALALKEDPFGIQLGIDVLKLGSFALDFETKYEGQVGLSYKQVYLIFEAGYGHYASALAYKNSNDYEVEGQYYRLGIEYAFNIGTKNQLLLGVRYGNSSFGDKGTFQVNSDLWDNYKVSVARSNAEATWGEIVLGSQTSIAQNLYFGWYFRWRKMFERTSYEPIDIYNVPGYGKSFDKSVPALNLFFKYKLSF